MTQRIYSSGLALPLSLLSTIMLERIRVPVRRQVGAGR